MNSKSKHPAKSVTVWGSLISALFGLLAVTGVEIAPGELSEVTNALGVIIGFAVALFGRMRAKVPVRFRSDAATRGQE